MWSRGKEKNDACWVPSVYQAFGHFFFLTIVCLLLTTALQGRLRDPHFIDEVTEGQSG